MTRKLSLSVNGSTIPTDYFVSSFMDHTIGGMMEALEGTAPIKALSIALDGKKLSIKLNGASVPINPFVTNIMRATLVGMVSSLKGVVAVDQMTIYLER
jgi:hypothetical protein